MQLESHATPPQESPQQRYAALHRAILRGLDSDEVWRDLAEVCLELGLDDEASRCVRRLRSQTTRLALESRLSRKGIPVGTNTRPAQAHHPEAPAASNAGPTDEPSESEETRADRFEIAGLTEHLVDAVQFLFVQHMPWLVLLTTLAFPLVVGLGGFLTAGDSPFSLTAIAALPGVCVLAVVGAMGRRILVSSSEGGTDVPALADLNALFADAQRFLVDATLVLGSLLAPSILALVLGAPMTTTLPALCVGLFFAPLAWGLRQVRRDLGALSPVTLLRGVARSGLGYVGLAILCVSLFVPAGVVAWASLGRPVWVQIAIIGPLCVLPLFVVSRLLGTWLDSMRLELGAVLLGAQSHSPRDVRSLLGTSAPDTGTPRFPRRPDALVHFEAPKLKNGHGMKSKPTPPKPAGAAKPAARAAAPQPTAKRPTAQPPAKQAGARPGKAPAPAAQKANTKANAPTAAKPGAKTPSPAKPPAAPTPPEPRSIEGRSPRRPALTDAPDLSTMPGAVVVSGQERVKQGAAARPR